MPRRADRRRSSPTIGGFNPVAVRREAPARRCAELDAIAPSNPVYLQVAFTGPCIVQQQGKAFFESVTSPLAGPVTARRRRLDRRPRPAPSAPWMVLYHLRVRQTFDDKKRSTADAMAYAAQLGVTSSFDMGGFLIPGSPDHEDEFTFDGAASWDPYTAYDPLLDLHRGGPDAGADPRLLPEHGQRGRDPDPHAAHGERVPRVRQRLAEDRRPRRVHHQLAAVRPGRAAVELPGGGAEGGPAWLDLLSSTRSRSAEDSVAIGAWETINQTVPIAPLHWSVAHALTITPANIARLKAIGGGLALHGFRYLAGTPTSNGPPYRTILDSGIHAGAGSDSAQISALNPWLMLYYMTTGKNSSGQLINAGQTLTRQEALRLYTAENGWFSKEEDKLGSIEVGKLGRSRRPQRRLLQRLRRIPQAARARC